MESHLKTDGKGVISYMLLLKHTILRYRYVIEGHMTSYIHSCFHGTRCHKHIEKIHVLQCTFPSSGMEKDDIRDLKAITHKRSIPTHIINLNNLISSSQPKTPQTCCKLSILPACCNLLTSCSNRLVATCHLQTCYNFLKQVAASLLK